MIDASNVAMRHGKNTLFSVKGLQIVVEYWQKNGHQVVCFLPDYLFSYDQVNMKKRLMARVSQMKVLRRVSVTMVALQL